MIRYRVRKVMELRDSVTGSPVVSSNVRILTSGVLKRLDKGEGLVVLMDDGSGPGIPEDITISSGIYMDTTCTVPEHSKASAQVCTIWLVPSPGYPLPVGIASVNGHAAAGTRIEITDAVNRQPLKLAQDYDPQQETIKLYHDRGTDPMGKWYRAVSTDISMPLFIGAVVDKSSDYTEYTAQCPKVDLAEKAGKTTVMKASETAFYPMMRTYADDKGAYLAIVTFAADADTELTLAFSDPASEGGEKSAEMVAIHLGPGERLRIDEKES